MSSLSAPYLHNEEAAHAFVEAVLWPQGAHCPRCGSLDRITKVKANPEKRIRVGLYRCGSCKRQFTVKVGTIFEDSKIGLHLWMQAIVLMTASKKGISAHQLHRTLEVTYKTAWFMEHRIREAMRDGALAPFGSAGGAVEVDETFIGVDRNAPTDVKKLNWVQRNKVLALVDRDQKAVRTMVIDDLKVSTIRPIVEANVAREARIMTDEAPRYKAVAKGFASHQSVNHGAGEYGRGEAHTNTVEGFFSIFKRGMKGVYQHCGQQHLHRYLAEFEFRYNNRIGNGVDDAARAKVALKGVTGKRLLYRDS